MDRKEEKTRRIDLVKEEVLVLSSMKKNFLIIGHFEGSQDLHCIHGLLLWFVYSYFIAAEGVVNCCILFGQRRLFQVGTGCIEGELLDDKVYATTTTGTSATPVQFILQARFLICYSVERDCKLCNA